MKKNYSENCKLKPEQMEWIESTAVVIQTLIKETPPDGPEFLEIVKKILQVCSCKFYLQITS